MKFYSEKLNKMFDDENTLLAEEEKALQEEQTAKAKALEKKEEAKQVEESFKLANAARREYNETIVKLRKQYNADLIKLRTTFEDASAEAKKALEAAELKYDADLKDFIAKHPEGYHMTLKDGDNVVTIKGNSGTDPAQVERLLAANDSWFDNWLEQLFQICKF